MHNGSIADSKWDTECMCWYFFNNDDSNDNNNNSNNSNIEGFQPEWYILTISHCRDIRFWSETLDMISTLKGTIQDFCNLLVVCELSPTCTLRWQGRSGVQITCSTLSAYHVKHVMCHVV